MTVILALVGLFALVATLVALVRAIATDGYGTRPPPRSHQEELGSWITQQSTSPPPWRSKDTDAAT